MLSKLSVILQKHSGISLWWSCPGSLASAHTGAYFHAVVVGKNAGFSSVSHETALEGATRCHRFSFTILKMTGLALTKTLWLCLTHSGRGTTSSHYYWLLIFYYSVLKPFIFSCQKQLRVITFFSKQQPEFKMLMLVQSTSQQTKPQRETDRLGQTPSPNSIMWIICPNLVL